MKRSLWISILSLLIAVSFVFAMAACTGGDDDDDNDTGGGEQGELGTGEESFAIDLEFEYRDQGRLEYTVDENGDVEGTLTIFGGNDLVIGGETLEGTGRLIDIPESAIRMLSMRFHGDPTWAACQEQPIAYSLVFTFTGDNGFYVGGLSAYCGKAATGRPARIMRLNGFAERVDG